eukprot:m.170236 g.170236  ORF g.170236 m.170236 type:complete len:420 (+) comp18261_c0_seq2:252-1511(+)
MWLRRVRKEFRNNLQVTRCLSSTVRNDSRSAMCSCPQRHNALLPSHTSIPMSIVKPPRFNIYQDYSIQFYLAIHGRGYMNDAISTNPSWQSYRPLLCQQRFKSEKTENCAAKQGIDVEYNADSSEPPQLPETPTPENTLSATIQSDQAFGAANDDDHIPDDVLEKTRQLEELVAKLSETVKHHQKTLEVHDKQRRLWQPESIEKLHERILTVDTALVSTTATINRWSAYFTGREFMTPGILALLAALLGVLVAFKQRIYEFLGREAADVASTAISDERTIESVLNTIKLIANSPEAIDSVTALFKSVLQQPETQDAMNYLLTNLLADPYTKQIGVDYLMWVLQDEAMETWMNTQATSLVTATVNDPEVQQSTGQGAWRAFMYGFTPQYIRPDYWRQPPSPPIVADVLIEDEGEDTSGTT